MGLIRYATRFMLERRSREFANYLLLGMRKKKVCRLFLIENIGIGACCFLCGLALGSLLYQIIRSILLNSLLETSYSFSIDFSFSALSLTFLYFFLAYFLALRKSSRRSVSYTHLDLISNGDIPVNPCKQILHMYGIRKAGIMMYFYRTALLGIFHYILFAKQYTHLAGNFFGRSLYRQDVYKRQLPSKIGFI